MQLVTYTNRQGNSALGGSRPGVLQGNKIIDLLSTDPALPGSLREILAAGDTALAAVAQAAGRGDAVIADDAILDAPIPNPEKVICIGLNYSDHVKESGAALPQEPVIFNKFPNTVIGPDQPIRLPRLSDQVDYEAELVVVIGRGGHEIAVEAAMEHVAGYTVGHDVSARDWQLGKDGGQWLLGKTFDTFAPTGPALVTPDEITDPHDLRIQFRLNGEVLQDSNTKELIFRIDHLIAYLSQVVTLTPGDLIFTGTPPGVGFARKPPVFLKDGDLCEVEIEGLGVLSNRCTR